jgi:hypothetical protein
MSLGPVPASCLVMTLCVLEPSLCSEYYNDDQVSEQSGADKSSRIISSGSRVDVKRYIIESGHC